MNERDPISIAMAVREVQALVVVGAPTVENMQSPAIEEAITSMIPVVALCAEFGENHDAPAGISFVLDPQLGPEHLATALSALIARQREIRRLQLDTASAIKSSGGLRNQIDNIQEELQLAASVQREFLPRILPTLGGIASAALWRPAAYVSGDLYNVMRLDEHHLGLFVTDAVGHGVPAALLTLVISRSLPTKEINGNSYRILSPSEALTRVNADMMTRAGRTTRFATAIYAVIDTRNRQLTVASAGHLPMMRISRGGTCEAIPTVGGLLGVFEDETFTEKVITLSAGDKLLFYTDGFEQAFPELGQDPSAPRLPNHRYLDVFNEFASVESSQAFIENINKRLDEESDDFPQIDDLTLLCASWTGI
jgi:sigma-B regulation protein RsbU (phosphoserine phosphatase)